MIRGRRLVDWNLAAQRCAVGAEPPGENAPGSRRVLPAARPGDDEVSVLIDRDGRMDLLIRRCCVDVDRGADGRIVRLQPSRPDDRPGIATPSTGSSPAAIVDFITGFDRPTAMVSGLDGSLYVLDSGRGIIYQIRPA